MLMFIEYIKRIKENKTLQSEIKDGVQGRMQDFKLGGHTLKNGAERREARTLLGYFV
jgi:hypothetical protein